MLCNRVVYLSLAFAFCAHYASAQNSTEPRCKVPNKAPANIEKVIALCQEEIKQTLIAEALEALQIQEAIMSQESEEVKQLAVKDLDVKSRRKRSFFSDDEKKIAGCLLQCVFRRKNALNTLGYPSVEGLVNLYTEGVDEQSYVLATVQAVHTCLNKVQIIIDQNVERKKDTKDNGTTCEVAYQVFDCVSDKIQDYCGQSP